MHQQQGRECTSRHGRLSGVQTLPLNPSINTDWEYLTQTLTVYVSLTGLALAYTQKNANKTPYISSVFVFLLC